MLLENHKVYDDDKREKLIKYIKSSSESAYALMENLFTWARSQSGDINYSPEQLDLHIIVQEVTFTADSSSGEQESSPESGLTNCN